MPPAAAAIRPVMNERVACADSWLGGGRAGARRGPPLLWAARWLRVVLSAGCLVSHLFPSLPRSCSQLCGLPAARLRLLPSEYAKNRHGDFIRDKPDE